MNETCLVLDATNRWTVCGLRHGETWTTDTLRTRGDVARSLVPLIGRLLERAGVKQPDWIVAARGPGSFTGTRLTVNAARSLAQFWDLPVLSVESLEFYAFACAGRHPDLPLGVLVDGKQQRVFARRLNPGQAPFAPGHEHEETFDIDPARLRELWDPDTVYFADDPDAVRRYLNGRWPEIRLRELLAPSAADLFAAALALGGRERAGAWEDLMPIYARPDPARAKFPDGLEVPVPPEQK